jgi:hypothetical protein
LGLGVGGLAVLFVALEVENSRVSLKVSETKQVVGSSFEGLLSFLWFTDSTQKKLESES